MPSVAQADLVLFGATPAQSFIDLGAQGFGNAPRMLTLQGTGQQDSLTGAGTPVDQASGDVPSGENKVSTPTLTSLGWTSGANVGIGFNSDQSGGTGVTMQGLVLTIYNGTNAVISFELSDSLKPLNFTAADLAMQQGNGNAVFNFVLDATQQAQFDAAGLLGSFTAGLSSTLGCPTAVQGCLVTNDGPDSFVGFQQPGNPTVVPEPSALLLAGTALLGVGYSLRHRISRRTRGQLASS